MTTNNEQEAFSLVIDRQKSGASESDIRYAFMQFMNTAGVASNEEMFTEAPPGAGNPGRMDLYVHNTCIEFKTNILQGGQPHRGYVSQLNGYIENLLKAGTGVRNGVLTDGVHFFLRRIGEEKLPLLPYGALQTFDRPRQAANVREYLHKSSPHRPKTSAQRRTILNATSAETQTRSEQATYC